jgi:dTMP kinase
MRGRFITFEGGEGSGKSTQTKLLADRLKRLGLQVVLTREPGGSPGAEVIRHVLLSGAAKPLGTHAEAILFAAARDDHVREIIQPALRKGHWVVCDRFADSTRVYQGTVGNVDPRLIRALERISVRETKPDLTFVLDLPAEEGLARSARRRGGKTQDRFEGETLEFHQKLREAFRELTEQEPQRCILIDGTQMSKVVADTIWSIVNKRFQPQLARLNIA